MVEIADLERHAEIGRGYHFLTVFSLHLGAFQGKAGMRREMLGLFSKNGIHASAGMSGKA
jgi:hypothetical protein